MLMWSVGNLETPPPNTWVAKLLVATQVGGCMGVGGGGHGSSNASDQVAMKLSVGKFGTPPPNTWPTGWQSCWWQLRWVAVAGGSGSEVVMAAAMGLVQVHLYGTNTSIDTGKMNGPRVSCLVSVLLATPPPPCLLSLLLCPCAGSHAWLFSAGALNAGCQPGSPRVPPR
jgi:hypothetical protein